MDRSSWRFTHSVLSMPNTAPPYLTLPYLTLPGDVSTSVSLKSWHGKGRGASSGRGGMEHHMFTTLFVSPLPQLLYSLFQSIEEEEKWRWMSRWRQIPPPICCHTNHLHLVTISCWQNTADRAESSWWEDPSVSEKGVSDKCGRWVQSDRCDTVKDTTWKKR